MAPSPWLSPRGHLKLLKHRISGDGTCCLFPFNKVLFLVLGYSWPPESTMLGKKNPVPQAQPHHCSYGVEPGGPSYPAGGLHQGGRPGGHGGSGGAEGKVMESLSVWRADGILHVAPT